MKILYDNYLKDSTITVDKEDSFYPVENVYHKFLEKIYKPDSLSCEIEILFPENRLVSSIAVGYTSLVEVASDSIMLVQGSTDDIQLTQGATDTILLRVDEGVDYELQNYSGTVLGSGQVTLGNDINMSHFTPVTCRKVVLFCKSLSDIHIGGISIGDSLYYEYININPTFNTASRGSVSKTIGGQTLGRKYRQLREWDVTLPSVSNDKRQETEAMIADIGYNTPVYADIYDENHDVEPPVYCTITNYGQFQRDSVNRTYAMGLSIEEAR